MADFFSAVCSACSFGVFAQTTELLLPSSSPSSYESYDAVKSAIASAARPTDLPTHRTSAVAVEIGLEEEETIQRTVGNFI